MFKKMIKFLRILGLENGSIVYTIKILQLKAHGLI